MQNVMRFAWKAVVLSSLLAFMTGPGTLPGAAQTSAEEIGEEVLDGCNTELARFCAEVTPGEQRLLACLYAHGDKLATRCEYALYDAAARLERAIGSLTYVVSECRTELEAHCAQVEGGEGRVARCLTDHASELSPGCDRALTEVGLK
jgi:hypothetical protein